MQDPPAGPPERPGPPPSAGLLPPQRLAEDTPMPEDDALEDRDELGLGGDLDEDDETEVTMQETTAAAPPVEVGGPPSPQPADAGPAPPPLDPFDGYVDREFVRWLRATVDLGGNAAVPSGRLEELAARHGDPVAWRASPEQVAASLCRQAPQRRRPER